MRTAFTCMALATTLLSACGDTPAGADSTSTAAAKTADACANRPANVVEAYRAKLDVFENDPGFAVNFTQGQVLNDEDEIAVTVSEANFNDGLGYQSYYLSGCSAHLFHDGNLYNQGDGRWTTTMQTGTGSDIPDGTLAYIEVRRTRLTSSPDGGLPKATVTTVGRYSVRINNPK